MLTLPGYSMRSQFPSPNHRRQTITLVQSHTCRTTVVIAFRYQVTGLFYNKIQYLHTEIEENTTRFLSHINWVFSFPATGCTGNSQREFSNEPSQSAVSPWWDWVIKRLLLSEADAQGVALRDCRQEAAKNELLLVLLLLLLLFWVDSSGYFPQPTKRITGTRRKPERRKPVLPCWREGLVRQHYSRELEEQEVGAGQVGQGTWLACCYF